MRWKFEVTENGAVVANGEAPNQKAAISECSHYVHSYVIDDGDVKGIIWTRRKPKPRPEMQAINAELAALK